MSTSPDNLILLTGATGYVGGRLLGVLEGQGRPVRCIARDPRRLAGRVADSTEVVVGDLLDPATLAPALAGVHTACYLVHSMGAGEGFQRQDREAAGNFAAAARAAGVRRIIYLGGLGDSGEDLSPHLASRQEVGRILRESGVETVEFRASIVLGSGSLSFEMIRALVERLPVMVTPRWVRISAQPIAVGDLLAYLAGALDLPAGESRVIEIGGADAVSYGQLMREYARQRGLRRWMIPVPVLSPRLSSLWLSLVTPLYARVGRKLIGSIRHPTVVRDDSAARAFPDIRPVGVAQAIADALANEDRTLAETRWSDALSASPQVGRRRGARYGSRLIDSRTARVDASPERAFAPIARIGGRTGWYYGTWLWRLRGAVDLLLGGVGMRRGRRDPQRLAVGDTLDFWRVEAWDPPRELRLSAEMKLPGRAWLAFEVAPDGGGSIIRQTAVYDPAGLFGLLYWYALWPVHALIFRGMLRNIAEAIQSTSPRNRST